VIEERAPLPLRVDLLWTPHPSDPAVVRVTSPDSGRRFQLPTEALTVAQYFDGRRSLREVSDALRADGGPWVAERVVGDLAADLARLDLLGDALRAPAAPRPQWEVEAPHPDLPVEAHPDARFHCVGVGSCCKSGYLIPLDRLGADRVRRAARRQGLDDDLVVVARSSGGRWTHALDNDPHCQFLTLEHRCRLHGRSAHPKACQVFPLAFVRLGTRVLGTVTHRCGCGSLGRGRRLRSQLAALRRRSQLGPVPRVVPVLAVDDGQTAGISLAEHWVATTEQRCADARSLLRDVWATLGPVERDEAAPVLDLDRWLRDLAQAASVEGDPMLNAVFAGQLHPRQAELEADLRRAGLTEPRASVEDEVYRFARDHLYGLRPLHHGSLTRGLFAATLATADLLRQPDHLRARVRMMLWEDVFVSPSFRGLMGPLGPFDRRLASAGPARHQAEALLAAS
jgi:hypothetical protein